MPHENATATRLLATHCAVCNRPLVDAQSVESGIGPICRERYFGVEALTEPARVEANTLVYRIAAELSQDPSDANLANVSADLQRLRELGATTIVDRILANRGRLAAIKIVIAPSDPARFGIVSPRNEAVTMAFRQIIGRRWYGGGRTWDAHTRLNVFGRAQWPAVRDALRASFGDAFARLPNGDVIILTADATPGFDVPERSDAITGPADAGTTIRIEAVGGYTISVATPYSAEIVDAFRNIRGRRWTGSRNTFPRSALAEVVRAVRLVWPTATIMAPGFNIVNGAAVEPTAYNIATDTAINEAVAGAGVDLPQPMANRITGAPRAAEGWQARARAHATDELPAVDYNDNHSAWLAEGLSDTLTAGGFGRVYLPNTTEVVFGLRLNDTTEVLVYTSISDRRGGMAMRGRGQDAIRVAVVGEDSARGTTRINRTGAIVNIVTRVLDRVEELAAE